MLMVISMVRSKKIIKNRYCVKAFKSIFPASSISREHLKSFFPFFVEIELARKMDLKTITKYWFLWSGGHARAHTRLYPRPSRMSYFTRHSKNSPR